MNIIKNCNKIFRPFSTKSVQRFVQVCILGADTPSGQMAALLLKQNPTISTLHLQGTSKVEGMAIDLSHFDTRCGVQSYHDMESVSKSIKRADIVVIMGLNSSTSKISLAKQVMAEGPRVAKLAENCAKYAPRAIILVSVNPVSVTLPIVSEVYKLSEWYHPGRILGAVGIAQIKANALAGKYQNLDPHVVHVPIIGGPDVDCALPLFSRTRPAGMSVKDEMKLLEEFKNEIPCPIVSQALGVNRMVTAIALGLNDSNNANITAFVRSNIVRSCRHMVCTVKMGKAGVTHNYGLQKLHKEELTLFEEICLELQRREEMASDIVHRKDKCALPAFMVKEIEEEKRLQTGVIR